MPAARDLVTIDQHRVQFRQAAGRAGNPLQGVHHEHKDPQLALHHLDQTRRWHAAEPELGDETLAGFHGIFEALMPCDPERPAQERCGTSHPGRDRTKRGDPSPGAALIGREALRPDIGLPPREFTLSDEQERIGKIVQRRAELLDGDDEFLGGDAAFASLYRGNGLTVLEAEHAREIILRQLTLLAQRLDPRADELGHGRAPPWLYIILQIAECKIILRTAGRAYLPRTARNSGSGRDERITI